MGMLANIVTFRFDIGFDIRLDWFFISKRRVDGAWNALLENTLFTVYRKYLVLYTHIIVDIISHSKFQTIP